MKRKYLIPIIAGLTFVVGTVFIMLPFIPLGWFLYALAVLLLVPYFKPFQRAFEWIARRDKSGFTKRACRLSAKVYLWARDEKNADVLEKLGEECEPASKNQTK